MSDKEATARIKINKLLEAAGWRFFADARGPANIQLEPSVMVKMKDLDALSNNFEKANRGFIDFLLLNEKGFPFIILEAKAEKKDPLVGKEQARKYAKSQNCRFVILSNGNLHYFWDLERGNPYIITAFPSPESVGGYQKSAPDPKRLIDEVVGDDYVVLTQRPNYASEAAWRNEDERARYIEVSDIGGGYPASECGQSDIALGWMIEKARGAGLVFDDSVMLAHELHPDPLAKLHNSKTGVYWPTPGIDRIIGHPLVTADTGKNVDGPDLTQSLHPSVLVRWDGDPEYRPKSLMNYFKLTSDARGVRKAGES